MKRKTRQPVMGNRCSGATPSRAWSVYVYWQPASNPRIDRTAGRSSESSRLAPVPVARPRPAGECVPCKSAAVPAVPVLRRRRFRSPLPVLSARSPPVARSPVAVPGGLPRSRLPPPPVVPPVAFGEVSGCLLPPDPPRSSQRILCVSMPPAVRRANPAGWRQLRSSSSCRLLVAGRRVAGVLSFCLRWATPSGVSPLWSLMG